MKAQFLLLLVCAGAAVAQTNQPPERPGLRVNSEFGQFNLREKTAYYSNNVTVFDPPAKPGDPPTVIHCRELTAWQSATGRIDKIIGVGAVQIDQGDTHARANHAVYYATNETMVLTGAFDAQNPQPYMYSSQGKTYADVIVYDRLTGRISVHGNVKTEIHGSTLKGLNKTNATNTTRAPRPLSPGNP
jgi:lipopolysaccharide export system protein LptA